MVRPPCSPAAKVLWLSKGCAPLGRESEGTAAVVSRIPIQWVL